MKLLEFSTSMANFYKTEKVYHIELYNEDGSVDYAHPKFGFVLWDKYYTNIEKFRQALELESYEPVANIIATFFSKFNEQKDIDRFVNLCVCSRAYVNSYKRNIFDPTGLLMQATLNFDLSVFSGITIAMSYDYIDKGSRIIYTVNNLKELLAFDVLTSLTNLRQGDFFPKIKECKNCSRFFIVENRSDVKYCNFSAPQKSNYRCSDPQVQILYGANDIETEIKKNYRRVYAALQTRIKRHPRNKDYVKDLAFFKECAEGRKNNVEKGHSTEEEYLEWLKYYPY
jgi:hypothetical protein